ncbi:hypothetical protein EDD85DRAFT_956712 [Armillaria nabsnona]|nr:hypothetical protein EDD85DRAFT_956712 [Armillaria nabsnona]
MTSPLSPQEQHITLSRRLDSTVEAVSSSGGNVDGASRPNVVRGEDESTPADVWNKLWKTVYYLAIEFKIVGIFKSQNGTTATQGDSKEGEQASENSHSDLCGSSWKAGEESNIPQRENTDASGKTSTPPLHNSAVDARSTPNLSDTGSANAAPTSDSPFSPSTPAYQRDCTFEFAIGNNTDMASTANPIYQIGCNVAPNVSTNAAMANVKPDLGNDNQA